MPTYSCVSHLHVVEVHHILTVPQQLHNPNLPLQVLADLRVLLEVAFTHRLHSHLILPILQRGNGTYTSLIPHARALAYVRLLSTFPSFYLSMPTRTLTPPVRFLRWSSPSTLLRRSPSQFSCRDATSSPCNEPDPAGRAAGHPATRGVCGTSLSCTDFLRSLVLVLNARLLQAR